MKNRINTNSKRQFLLAWIEGEDAIHKRHDLDDIMQGDGKNNMRSQYEYIYALQDEIDAVLDLKQGETIPFQFNRDNEDSKGVIKRIK